MRVSTKTFGLIFLAAASVYSDRAIAAGPATSAKTGVTDVKLLDDLTDLDATDPFASDTADASTQPVSTGVSVDASQVTVSDLGTVEIHVNDASLVEVLRMLSLQSQKNIIASKDVRGTITANLYDVTIREALDAVLHANGYAYREKGNFIYVYSAKELAEIEKAERKMTTEVFRLYYTPAANAVTMLKPVLSNEAQVSFTTPPSSGLASGTGDVGGNSHSLEDIIVITDYADNLEKVRMILKEVDRRPQQILIEATILRATLSEDNSLGVDFAIIGGFKFSDLIGTSQGSANSAANGGLVDPNGGAGMTDYTGVKSNFTNGLPNGGIRVGYVGNNVAVFLQALESITDTVVLANPKVLALNKQKGEVIVGRKDGYLTTTVTESSTVQTVEFLDTGTRLIFRPYIGDDGFIRMEIHPEDSSGGLTGANLPFKVTTEVTSNVMVKDGHTIVIGGLFRESSDTARGQVPFLGNLPLAGPLFRNQRDRTTREEVIILLTPHIVKDEAVFSAESEELMRDAEKLRVGVRQGMMPWGRERLAESCYESAVAEMKKPNASRKKALWHLDCALHLNPKFIEAIDMKQQLTGQEVTAVDNSSIRSFVRRQMLVDLRAPEPLAPATNPVSEAPATRPAVETHQAAVPATQPAEDAALVAEAVDADELLVEAPSTQPVAKKEDEAEERRAVGRLRQAVARLHPGHGRRNRGRGAFDAADRDRPGGRRCPGSHHHRAPR
jgi:type IV pilus assembly protein PilQ